MPKPRQTRTPKPDWARAIAARRTWLELSQELVAERADMSQSYYSEIERGDRELPTLTHALLVRLANALEWDLAQLQEETGVDLGIPDSKRPVPTPRPLPDSLLQAGEIHGRRFPDLLDPTWQRYLASFRPRGARDDDPEVWLDLYRDLVRHGITPGGH